MAQFSGTGGQRGPSLFSDQAPQKTSEAPIRRPDDLSWRDALAERIPEDLGEQIDVFEQQIELRRAGRIDEKIFAETRLRRGVYGQRYDNGQRHDGVAIQTLEFPQSDLSKGPNTQWDAPGMLRIKIPMGRVSAQQLDTMAEVAEENADGILHITTRQDIQLHYVHLEDTPDVMRRLAASGITTQEACGNVTRNVCACPLAGVCGTEAFDVSPHTLAATNFLLGHPDAQDFGRKFKIAFSGCADQACGLAHMHDIGFVAQKKVISHPDGTSSEERGFAVYMGGGLGAVPHQAKLFDDFVPEGEILPLTQATCRVFARLGEKKNRNRARLKFLVSKLGLEEFRRLVLEERAKLPEDPAWTAYLSDLEPLDGPRGEEDPGKGAGITLEGEEREAFRRWQETNCQPQPQAGYHVVTVNVPLGDLTSDQSRGLADLARRFTGDTMRFSVEQNLLFRWVAERDLEGLYRELGKLGLQDPGAGTIVDITACPGTDTCKLGISSSRGLAVELRRQLGEQQFAMDDAVKGLRIKVSGCFNSCGQHHVSDIGFLGVSRRVGGYMMPHFQLVVGGQWSENAGAYGLPVGAVPSKRIPAVVARVTDDFSKGREGNEGFQEYVGRVGRAHIKALLQDLVEFPTYEKDPSLYTDWADARLYSTDDKGVGECAGEVVSAVDFGLQESEREVFVAIQSLDKKDVQAAADAAYRAMLQAAKTLVRIQNLNVGEEPDAIVNEFRSRFHETKIFHDPFAGEKFARYFFAAHEDADNDADFEKARTRIEEAQLFVEAAHSCYGRMSDVA